MVEILIGIAILGGLGLVFAEYPKCWEGFPIALVTAGLMALAFMGFSGLKVW